jgi:hypothetical protein
MRGKTDDQMAYHFNTNNLRDWIRKHLSKRVLQIKLGWICGKENGYFSAV